MALSVLSAYLNSLGLGSLLQWASNMLINGASEDEVLIEIENQPAFKQRFWMLDARRNNGYPPMSPNEVLEYEQTMSSAASALGLNVTQQEVGQWIADNKSVSEMQDRMGIAAQAVYMEPPETRNALERLYGVTSGELARYWLNPKEQTPILQRRFAASQIAASASRTGWGDLTSQQAEDLAQRGLDTSSAMQGFGTLVEIGELFQSVDQTEEDIDTEGQLRLLTGDTGLTQQVERRGEKRRSYFEAGGGFASGREGLAGLGSANR